MQNGERVRGLVFGLLMCAVLWLATSEVQAADKQAGERKAASCVACHGPQGKSVNPVWPNLAGQKQAYLVKQLKDFKEGRRQDPMMAPLAQALSESDIADIAAYFSSL